MASLAEPAFPPIPTGEIALFLDFDGTLVDFAPTPEAVRPDAQLNSTLAALHAALGGAVAIVSGRAVARLDELLAPLRLPSAGIHGLERRASSGDLHRLPVDGGWLAPLRAEMQRYVTEREGLLLEDKGVSLALHFRRALHRQAEARARVQSMQSRYAPRATLIHGDGVVEVVPEGCDKGAAVEWFLQERPFAGRRSVYLGDDTNDLSAMRKVEASGGMAIAVGGRITANWRLPSPAVAREWLGALASRYSRS